MSPQRHGRLFSVHRPLTAPMAGCRAVRPELVLVCHVLRKSRPETRIMQTLSIPRLRLYCSCAKGRCPSPLVPRTSRTSKCAPDRLPAIPLIWEGVDSAGPKKPDAARRASSFGPSVEDGKVKILITIALVFGRASAS